MYSFIAHERIRPGPPLPYSQGVPTCMLIPHHLNPPISRKRISKDIYPPISGIGYRWQLQKTHPFFWFSREIFQRLQPKNTPPPFPEKMGTPPPPLMHLSGGPGRILSPLYKLHTLVCVTMIDIIQTNTVSMKHKF